MAKQTPQNTSAFTDTIVLPDHQVAQNKRTHAKIKLPFLDRLFKKRSTTQEPEVKKRKKGFRTWQKVLVVVLAIFLVFASAAGATAYYVYGVAKTLKAQSEELKASANIVKDQLKTQNLPGAKAAFADVQKKVDEMKAEYQKLAFLSAVPVANLYYNDGIHGFAAAEAGVRAGVKTIDAVVPYADVLGFAGEGTFSGGTAEDRIRLLLETLGKISPVIDDISNELQTADTELAKISPARYPEKIGNTEVKSQLQTAQKGIKEVVAGINEFRPAIEVIPEIAGSGGKRKKYLVLFQNENELRPTGGFMTAYAIMFVENGKVYPEKSDDIYELDKKFKKNIPIPEILGKYLTSEKRWNLRDMNIDPDFKDSMEVFLEHYKEVKGEPGDIDGIITVDSKVLSDLVSILGPVDVPGFGTFTAENDKRCDCPQIIYALSEIVDKPTPFVREDRKGIIAPMMQTILQKAYSAPKEKWPELFQLAREKIEEKHVQMYFLDEKYQKAAEAINVAGRMNPIEDDNDYFAIVDANLGGAKSNLFIQQEVEQKVSAVKDGMVTKTVTIKYKNPRKGDNCNLEAGQLCLNGTLNDWIRIYVPEDAKLVESKGFDDGSFAESNSLGKHIFEGSFKLAPLSSSTLVITYQVPYKDTDTYKLQLRKQGGTPNFKYLLDVDGHEEEVILDKDKTVEIPY